MRTLNCLIQVPRVQTNSQFVLLLLHCNRTRYHNSAGWMYNWFDSCVYLYSIVTSETTKSLKHICVFSVYSLSTGYCRTFGLPDTSGFGLVTSGFGLVTSGFGLLTSGFGLVTSGCGLACVVCRCGIVVSFFVCLLPLQMSRLCSFVCITTAFIGIAIINLN